MKILLKGGRMIDPSQELDAPLDLLIQNGTIAKIGSDLPAGPMSRSSESRGCGSCRA